MTVETILKLDSIKNADDLTWRTESLDVGHPECKCSGCKELILDNDEFLESEEYFDAAGKSLEEQATDNFPIRLLDEKKNLEAVLHNSCFQYLHSKGLIQ